LRDEAAARELVRDAPLHITDLDQATAQEKDDFNIFLPLLRHARLLYILGDGRNTSEMVPDQTVSDRAGRIWFLRDVVVVARIWARARSGNPMTAWDVRQEVSGIMQRFNRSFNSSAEHHDWFICRRARGGLYSYLVRAVSEHGPEALKELREEFQQQWQGDASRYWPANVRRQVVTAFAHAHEEHREWAAGNLREIGKHMPWSDLHDLVQEAQKQAEAWVSLGEPEEARSLIQSVVRRATGISGEDYEFDTWIKWLDRLGDAAPLQALARLDWFAQAIVVLRETAEYRVASSAAYRLIKIAARLDPGRAVSLSRWLMDKGVIDHADRLKAFLEGILDSPTLPVRLATYVLGDLIIPFDTTADDDLPQLLVLAAYRVTDIPATQWAVEYLVRRIEVYALASTRKCWEESIRAAATQLGITLSGVARVAHERPDDHVQRRPPDRLVLDDESELSLEEVMSHETDIAALAALAGRERYSSDFDWTVAIERLRSSHSLDELRPIVRRLRHNRRVLTDLLAKGRECREAGDSVNAWAFARLALEATDKYRWSRKYGDGVRLDVTRALVNALPAEGRALLWQLLTHDGTKDSTILEEVLCQLRDQLPVQELWPEVEDHVRALFDEHIAAETASELPSAAASSAVGPALARTLIEEIDHPVVQVTRAARRACGLALLDGDADIASAVRSVLAGQGPLCRAALEVLDAASQRQVNVLIGLQVELQALAASPDAAVAVRATELCERSGVPQELQSDRKTLGGEYRIRLPEDSFRGLVRPDAPESGEPWPDTDDPRWLLGIVEWLYRLLSRRTNIQELVLLRRGARLMEALVPRAEWSSQGERSMTKRLDDAGLKFAFRRPRSDVAFRATHRLIGELWQAGQIRLGDVHVAVANLRMCDPALTLAEPGLRPSDVPIIATDRWGDKESESWVNDVASATSHLGARLGDGRIILAEYSELEAIGRNVRTERRRSVFCAESDSQLDEEHLIPQVGETHVAQYPSAATEICRSSLVIRNSYGATAESPAGDWVAFNPALALSMGWVLSTEGMFRWTDCNGKTMVESLWWVDGPIGLRGMFTENCAGEGWLVVASTEAITEIRKRVVKLCQVQLVSRIANLDRREEIHKEAWKQVAAHSLD
jgi:hypothetical protein